MQSRDLDDNDDSVAERLKRRVRIFGGVPPKVVIAIAAMFVIVIGWFQLFTHVDAGEIVVVQVPYTGTLHAYTDSGTYMRYGGKVTVYKKRSQYSFSAAKDQGAPKDESIEVRFNDGGHARVSGVISWEMPLQPEKIIYLHKEYESHSAIEQQLVRPTIERSMYLTSPMMSSTESYAARRTEFLHLFEDQTRNGIYQTRTTSKKEPDPITGAEKTVQVVQIITDNGQPDGKPLRESDSPFRDFGINVFAPSINRTNYDDDVEAQIKQQRDATMKVQTAKAQALEAEQRALTAVKNGEANAATAKWEQEVKKATATTLAEQEKQVAETKALQEKNVAVTKAEQERQVADLAKQAAEFTKAQNILLGEGESKRKQLVLAADGALEQKLKTYADVMGRFATAIATYKGNWVPGVVMGSPSGTATAGGAQQLIDMLMVKTARDLSLDMNVPAGAAVASK